MHLHPSPLLPLPSHPLLSTRPYPQVILLEGLQKGLYEVAGRLQHQLYLLDDIRARLLAAEQGTMMVMMMIW